MNLLSETLALSIGMLFVCCLPIFFSGVQRYTGLLFIFGTGAMLGIFVFDLVPDVIEMGGEKGLLVALFVGLVYSLIHLFHLRHHQLNQSQTPKHDHKDHDSHIDHHGHSHSFPMFFVSIVSHCFASGILLAVSQDFSKKVEYSVFIALLAHKIYESITFTSILLNQKRSGSWNFIVIAIYCLSLPVGVLTTTVLHDQIGQSLAIYLSSIAVGSLFGCLVFDFLIPSFYRLRQQKLHFAWLVLGLVLTRVFMGWV